jgi:hypothetical protein
MEWKTIDYMKDEMNALALANNTDFTEEQKEEWIHDYGNKFEIISGMGKGIYVINLDANNAKSFQTKIEIVQSGAYSLALSVVSYLLFVTAL